MYNKVQRVQLYNPSLHREGSGGNDGGVRVWNVHRHDVPRVLDEILEDGGGGGPILRVGGPAAPDEGLVRGRAARRYGRPLAARDHRNEIHFRKPQEGILEDNQNSICGYPSPLLGNPTYCSFSPSLYGRSCLVPLL